MDKNLAKMMNELETHFQENDQEQNLRKLPEATIKKLYKETFSKSFDQLPYEEDR